MAGRSTGALAASGADVEAAPVGRFRRTGGEAHGEAGQETHLAAEMGRISEMIILSWEFRDLPGPERKERQP
jgi:hypothetical protein